MSFLPFKPSVMYVALLSVFAFLVAADDSPAQARRGVRAPRGRVITRAYWQHESVPVRSLLLTRVDRVAWDEVPLGEVLDWVRARSTRFGKVNVVPRWRVLAAAGVDRDTPITLTLERVNVAEVLYEVVDQLSGAEEVVYYGAGNKLRFTTRSALRRRLHTRSYDVAEILAVSRFERVEPGIVVSQQINIARASVDRNGTGAEVFTYEFGQSLFGNPENFNEQDEDDDDLDDENAQRLIETIRTTIEPDSWTANGGAGTLSIFNDVLIVRNSPDVHEIIAGRFYLR